MYTHYYMKTAEDTSQFCYTVDQEFFVVEIMRLEFSLHNISLLDSSAM